MSGVTSTSRKTRSSTSGNLRFEWLNIAVAFSTISKTSTAITGAPSATTTVIFHTIDRTISIGWKRSPVVRSKAVSA